MLNDARSLVLACVLAISPAAAGPGQEGAPRCALITTSQSPITALLEANLLAQPGATWVERAEIKRVLGEQQLALLLGPQSGKGRIALGHVLKADMLVLLEFKQENQQRYADMVVAETATGLRLLSRRVPLSEDSKRDIGILAQFVEQALRKYAEEIKEVFAVPAFACQDLGYHFEHLKGTYANLVEQRLLAQRGVLVVELAEADAIARELALAGSEAVNRRRLPVYVLGEYRNEGRGDDRRLTIRLRLQRSEKTLSQTEKTMMPGDARDFLWESAGKLTGWQDTRAVESNFEAEAKQLADRATASFKLGYWPEALALAEASLLLNPEQLDVRRCCVEAASILASKQAMQRDLESVIRSLSYRRRVFEHLQELERRDPNLSAICTICCKMLGGGGLNYRLKDFCELPSEIEQNYQPLAAEEHELLMRLAHRCADQGMPRRCGEILRRAVANMEPKEAYDLRRRLILQYQDKTSPSELLRHLGHYGYSQFWNSLEAREFLRQLIESESATAELRQHAERALAALNEARSQQAEKSAPESKPTAAPKGLTDGNQRVHFRPLDIAWRDARGSSGKLRYVAGCMAIDGGIDVLWDKADSVYLLKTKGKATRVWSQEPMEDVYYTEVKYDGRYLWIAANLSGQAAQLWVLDPLEEKLWQLTVDDGLPLYPPTLKPGNPISQSSVVRVGPLAPGEAIVAGSFGRSWLAKVRFDPSGKHAVNVFHEAREIPTRDDRQTWTSSAIFAPTYAITLGSKKQNGTNPLEQRVIIGGSPIHDYPLIVDPHELTVDLYHREWYQRDGSDIFRGAVYFAGSTSSNHDKLGLAVADATSISPRLLFDGIKEGIVVMQDEMVNVVGKRWWRGRIADRKLDDFGAVPWYYRNHWALSGPADVYRWQSTDLRLLGLGRSNHYGLLASYYAKDPAIGATLAQVLFDASADLQNQLAGTDTGGTKRQPSVPNTNTDIGDAWQYLPHATKAAFSRDGKWFVTASVNEILLWSTHDLRPIRRFAGLPGIVQDVAISHDGTRVAACSSKRETIVWDALTGESIQQFASYNLGFDRIDFLSDSRRVSTAGSADWVQIWDLETNEPTRIETLKHVAGVLPDGTVVGRSSGFPGRLVAWDPVDHSTRELFRRCWGIPIAISPDGRHVATHEMEGFIEGAYRVIYRTRVWELASGQELEVDRTKSTLISPVTLGTVDLPGGAVAELSLRGTERQWHFRRRGEHVR